jgi:hypothetical protein
LGEALRTEDSQTCRAQLERDGLSNQAISDEMTQSTLDFPSAKESGPGLDSISRFDSLSENSRIFTQKYLQTKTVL